MITLRHAADAYIADARSNWSSGKLAPNMVVLCESESAEIPIECI
jgi:hypothetical protein